MFYFKNDEFLIKIFFIVYIYIKGILLGEKNIFNNIFYSLCYIKRVKFIFYKIVIFLIYIKR